MDTESKSFKIAARNRLKKEMEAKKKEEERKLAEEATARAESVLSRPRTTISSSPIETVVEPPSKKQRVESLECSSSSAPLTEKSMDQVFSRRSSSSIIAGERGVPFRESQGKFLVPWPPGISNTVRDMFIREGIARYMTRYIKELSDKIWETHGGRKSGIGYDNPDSYPFFAADASIVQSGYKKGEIVLPPTTTFLREKEGQGAKSKGAASEPTTPIVIPRGPVPTFSPPQAEERSMDAGLDGAPSTESVTIPDLNQGCVDQEEEGFVENPIINIPDEEEIGVSSTAEREPIASNALVLNVIEENVEVSPPVGNIGEVASIDRGIEETIPPVEPLEVVLDTVETITNRSEEVVGETSGSLINEIDSGALLEALHTVDVLVSQGPLEEGSLAITEPSSSIPPICGEGSSAGVGEDLTIEAVEPSSISSRFLEAQLAAVGTKGCDPSKYSFTEEPPTGDFEEAGEALVDPIAPIESHAVEGYRLCIRDLMKEEFSSYICSAFAEYNIAARQAHTKATENDVRMSKIENELTEMRERLARLEQVEARSIAMESNIKNLENGIGLNFDNLAEEKIHVKDLEDQIEKLSEGLGDCNAEGTKLTDKFKHRKEEIDIQLRGINGRLSSLEDLRRLDSQVAGVPTVLDTNAIRQEAFQACATHFAIRGLCPRYLLDDRSFTDLLQDKESLSWAISNYDLRVGRSGSQPRLPYDARREGGGESSQRPSEGRDSQEGGRHGPR